MSASFLVGIASVAARSEVDIETVLRWIGNGSIPQPVLVGGLPRWNPDSLDAWRSSGCPKCQPPAEREMRRIRLGWCDDDKARIDGILAKVDAAMESGSLSPQTVAEVERLLTLE